MTSLFPFLLAALPLAQDPAPPVAGTDLVILRSGDELRGLVLVDTPGYLEIRVGSDTIVGIERAEVREVRRGEPPPVVSSSAAPTPEPTASSPSLLVGRDEWFVLHDGEGRSIGTLHATLRTGDEGEIKLAEEWEFVTERGRTQVTQLEALSADGVPSTCFYHERSLVVGESVPRDERLVRGSYVDGRLKIVRTTLRGTEQVEYPVGGRLALPLSLRETLRQRPGSLGGAGTRVVYDPSRDELQQQGFVSGERRRVEIEGKTIDVRETRIGQGQNASAEWIDGSGRAVRREVNGPALVAVRAGKDVAAAMVASKAKAYPAAVLREAEGRFSLWLPNPIWRFDKEQTPGQVTAHAALCGASVSALVLDQLPTTAHLAGAGESVERWLAVVCRDFKVGKRHSVEVRGQSALEITGSYQGPLGERRVRFEVSVLVLQTPADEFLALCFTAPANDFDNLHDDFDRMLNSLEVHPAAVAAQARPGKRKIEPR